MTGRLLPLAPEELAEQDRELLSPDGPFPGVAGLNWFATLVRHPGLYRKFLPFAGKLTFGGKLPARDREVLILRTAWRCRARYEWAHHIGAAREAGITDDELARITAEDELAASAAGRDGLLVRAADELYAKRALGDDTWSALRRRYDDRELIEIVLLCGTYQLVAMAMHTFGVELEADHQPGAWPAGW